jgi:6-phosphogluconolactonase
VSQRTVFVLENPEAAYVRVAEEIAHIAGEAICTQGRFTLALTGGSTPTRVYELLSTRFRLSVDWKEVHFFWGDERCVPPDDPGSNFAVANEVMLSKLNLSPSQIHRIAGEVEPEKAARDYEAELRSFFSTPGNEVPCFDLVLLGLGRNAHIASLFPSSRSIHESKRLVIAVEVDAPWPKRVTMTPPLFNAAERVIFLVTGEDKAQAVKGSIEGPHNPDQFPAQVISPERSEVLWVLDSSAASLLSDATPGGPAIRG